MMKPRWFEQVETITNAVGLGDLAADLDPRGLIALRDRKDGLVFQRLMMLANGLPSGDLRLVSATQEIEAVSRQILCHWLYRNEDDQ